MEVGSAFVNLEKLLKGGKDMVNAQLKVVEDKTGTSMGTLTVTVEAVTAVRQVLAGMKGSGGKHDADLSVQFELKAEGGSASFFAHFQGGLEGNSVNR